MIGSVSVDVDRALQPAGLVKIEAPVRLSNAILVGACEVGAFTYFNYGVEATNTLIGRYGSIGQRAIIGAGEHHTQFLTTHPIGADPSGYSAGMHASPLYHAAALTAASRIRAPKTSTILGHDVWIGANVVIMQGLTIGSGAVIGAGAVVTRNVEPYAVVAGAPARLLRFRFEPALCEAILASRWWDYDLSHLPMRDFSDPQGFLKELAERAPPPLQPTEARVG